VIDPLDAIAGKGADALRFGLAYQATDAQNIEKCIQRCGLEVDDIVLEQLASSFACLTDDVEWVVPGAFHAVGKAAFDREIENDAFVGHPTIRVARMVEESDVVVAEGAVRSARKEGGTLNLVFCDVFVMRAAKIRHLTSYLMEVKG
jgi:ketosteroid isomerase-like protein